ncbi:protein EFFECTOR OF TRANSCRIPTION 2-like [Rutidosis leptorrhynchoides]|uniref:protein EFFECTOR OF TRANSCRIPTION 2-like n=1 Tax=Rutidosis leptorrhynchoides TaxID=125765 RepID=UPI003A9997E4
MVITVNATVSSLLKREDCKRTKHDSAFSNWKILIGPCDWEDYLSNKEGAQRYRTHNLPNCSSCPGLYELGIVVLLSQTKRNSRGQLSSKNIIPVYLGQADNVRTRLQQYGRDGAHLENGLSNGEQPGRKVLGLFSDIFSCGFAIAFRWAPMENKKIAEKTESQLLETFDYAWNRGMNGDRRTFDILKKVKAAASSSKRSHLVFKKLKVIPTKEVGLRIKRCEPPVLENRSTFYYNNQKNTNFFSRIFKFTRSRPTLVSKEGNNMSNNEGGTCGVALGQGSICTRNPVEGRKRCIDHKGMKINAFVKTRLHTNTEDTLNLACGVTLDDGSFCTKVPVAGRKQCEEHKGMRIKMENKHCLPSSCLDLETGTLSILKNEYSNDTGVESLTCVAITLNSSVCKRKPGKDSKYCWQHEAARAKINHSSHDSDL